jgi:hypothetical protein
MLPLNAFSPATLVLEDISVGVAGSVRDEQIFVKWMGAIDSFPFLPGCSMVQT